MVEMDRSASIPEVQVSKKLHKHERTSLRFASCDARDSAPAIACRHRRWRACIRSSASACGDLIDGIIGGAQCSLIS